MTFHHTRSITMLMLIFVCGICSGVCQASYPCPYSGPTDDLTLHYHAAEYTLDVMAVFPEGDTPGYLSGVASLRCISMITGLDTIHLDFYQDDNAEIFEVSVDGIVSEYQFAASEIQIPITPALAEGDSVQIDVEYRVTGNDHFKFLPNPPRTPEFGFNAMVENSRWFPCLHDPRDKALYSFRVTVSSDRVVAANGTLESVTDNGDGTTTYFWSEHTLMASYLATINIASYTSFGHEHRGVPIVFYVLPETLEDAQVDFENVDHILDFYIDSFGPYPFEKLGLAQVRLAGAMENQDMISYGLITGDKEYEDTFAHEISHMYWGDSVTLTTCKDVWLNEGFASYCEPLWEEFFYSPEDYQRVLMTFKDEYFQEDAVHRYPIYNPDDVWSATTYQKGAWVLHMLRQILGDDRFWVVMQEYYDTYKFAHATTPAFQMICERHYSQPLDWFFQEWIYEQGYPEFEVSSTYQPGESPKLIVWVIQTQENAPETFRMPSNIRWTYADLTSESAEILIDSRIERFEFSVSQEPASVELDPDWRILKKMTVTEPRNTSVTLWMPSVALTPGDLCECMVTVNNYENANLKEYPLFVILDIYNQYFFAPSFSSYDNYLQRYPEFPLGSTMIPVLPSFEWPGGVGSGGPVYWYAGLTNPGMTELFGDMDTLSFVWSE